MSYLPFAAAGGISVLLWILPPAEKIKHRALKIFITIVIFFLAGLPALLNRETPATTSNFFFADTASTSATLQQTATAQVANLEPDINRWAKNFAPMAAEQKKELAYIAEKNAEEVTRQEINTSMKTVAIISFATQFFKTSASTYGDTSGNKVQSDIFKLPENLYEGPIKQQFNFDSGAKWVLTIVATPAPTVVLLQLPSIRVDFMKNNGERSGTFTLLFKSDKTIQLHCGGPNIPLQATTTDSTNYKSQIPAAIRTCIETHIVLM